MMHIIIDDRERFVTPFLTAVAEKFADITHEIKRINIGDYVITRDGEIIAVIERKTWRDLAASMRDGRKENMQKMIDLRASANAQGQGPITLYYFIEGNPCPNPDALVSRIPYKHLISHLDHAAARDNIHTVYVKTAEAMAQRLFAMARNFGTMRDSFATVIKQFEKIAQQNNDALSNSDEIHTERRKATNLVSERDAEGAAETKLVSQERVDMTNVINQLNQKKSADSTNLSILQSLDGVGKYAAYVLDTNGITLSHFHRETPERLRELLVECSKNTGYNQVFNVNIISRIIANKKYFTKDPEIDAPAYLRERTRRHIKLVSCVAGISEKMAAQILMHVPFHDIFNDPTVEARIAAVPRNEKTKLGARLAARIIHYFGIRTAVVAAQ